MQIYETIDLKGISDLANNACDWLRVLQIDTNDNAALWQTELNTLTYDEGKEMFADPPYYDLNKSAAIRAYYCNNVFDINTSRIKEIELLISPIMVNLQNPIIVKVNGKEVLNKVLKIDKMFLLKTFNASFDRKALWVTSVILMTN